MDTLPLTAVSLASFFHIKGSEVERYYKHHLSDFEVWEQKEHAKDWILLAKNIGPNCSIDETAPSSVSLPSVCHGSFHLRQFYC